MANKNSWDVLTTNEGDVLENGESSKRFSVRNYIPAKSNINYMKAILIGGGVIVATLIIIVTSVVLRNKYSQRINYYELMLSDGSKLWEIDPKTNAYNLRHSSNWDINTFDIYKGSLLYGYSNAAGVIYSSALNAEFLDPKSRSVLINQTNLLPDASAIDFLTGNLYLVDTEIGALIVLNVHTKHRSLIFTGLNNPTDIVLDPYEGVMFIAQKSDSILRMNMDGSSITKVVNDSDASHLSIDHNAKKIYWINDYVSIQSSDYDGQNKKVIMTDSKTITSFAVIENRLFWLWASSKNGSMGHCTLGDDGCESLKDEPIQHFQNAKTLKNIQIHKNDSVLEACEHNNGGCDHLCLAMPNNKRTCVCDVGWQLNADRISCRKIDSLILYSTTKHVKGRIPYNAKMESVDAIWPVEYNIEDSIVSFDYDIENDNFYFNNLSHIYHMKLKTPGEVKLLYKVEDGADLQTIAYDWSTKNLYFIKHIKFDSNHTTYTMVLNVEQSNQTKTLQSSVRDDFVSSYLYHVLLNINKNYFIVSGRENWSDKVLEKFTMNGTKIALNLERKYVKAIDFDKERLYADVYFSRDPRTFEHFYINGSKSQQLNVETYDSTKIIAMHVEEQWLYFQTEKAIYRCNKISGNSLKTIVPEHPDVLQLPESLTFMKVFNTKPYKLEKNPCAINNGGCSQFCFIADGRAACDCEDGKIVQKNGSCV